MTGETNGDASAARQGSRDALHNLCLADPVWVERYDGWTELGHGGSASVVRTRGKALGEELALKIFPRLTAEEWKRFQEEVRNALRLTSPYIVRTYSPFPRGSFAWIELELISGPNLRQELERRASEHRPFSLEEAVGVALAVAHALVTAHDAGVVHRDVKPANILLPADGAPAAKLSDFGISRLTGAARLTKSGLLVGTPQFAAPEVIGGGIGGPPSDLYSLTLCLYLMLSANRPPYDISDETSPTQWMRAHTDQRPLPITSFNPRVPRSLADLIERGLAKDPDRRPAAHEFADVLARLRHRPGETGRLASPAPRRTRWAVIGVVALVALAAGRLAFLRPGAERPQAGVETTIPSPATAAQPSHEPSVAVLPTAAPIATPGTRAVASPPVASPGTQPFQAVLDGEVLALTNPGAERASELRVTLVAGRRRFTARVADGLGAGEQLYLSLESFTPTPPSGLEADRVEILAVTEAGRRTAIVGLR